MKKSSEIFTYLLAFILLGVFFKAGAFSLSASSNLFYVYILVLVSAPFLALCKFNALMRISFNTITVFGFCGGIFLFKELFGILAAYILLGLCSILAASLFIKEGLPRETKETKHLEDRGLTEKAARFTVLCPKSFALLFKKSGFIAAYIATYSLLISMPTYRDEYFTTALYVIAIGFVGTIISSFFALPKIEKKTEKVSKSRFILISLLSFILLLICIYVLTGSMYSSPDPALLSALNIVKAIVIRALIGVAVAAIPGVLLGLLLSKVFPHAMRIILTGVVHIPTVLLTTLLTFTLSPSPYTALVSVFIPLLFSGALTFLNGSIKISNYKFSHVSDRKNLLLKPLLYRPFLASLPAFFCKGIFAALFLALVTEGTFYTLSSVSQILFTVILATILGLLFVLNILTKEAHGND